MMCLLIISYFCTFYGALYYTLYRRSGQDVRHSQALRLVDRVTRSVGS